MRAPQGSSSLKDRANGNPPGNGKQIESAKWMCDWAFMA